MRKKSVAPGEPMPTRVNIGGFDYDIVPIPVKEALESNILGDHNFQKLLIRVLQEGLHKQRQAEVIVHEVLHGCWSVANLPEKPKGEEQVVEALGLMLVQVIKHNPKLIDWIQDQLKDEP